MDSPGFELAQRARSRTLGVKMGRGEFKPSQVQGAKRGGGLESLGGLLFEECMELLSGEPTIGCNQTDDEGGNDDCS